MLQRYQCGFEGNQPKVCCPNNPPPASTTTTTTTTTRPPPVTGTAQNPPDVTRHANIGMINGDSCGQVITDRIVGGNRTAVMEMPWMALIAYNTREYYDVNFEHFFSNIYCIHEVNTSSNGIQMYSRKYPVTDKNSKSK